MPAWRTHALADELAALLSSSGALAGLVEGLVEAALEAALAYDAAIQRHAAQNEASDSWAESDELDRLYADWISQAQAALSAVHAQREGYHVSIPVRVAPHGVGFGAALLTPSTPAYEYAQWGQTEREAVANLERWFREAHEAMANHERDGEQK